MTKGILDMSALEMLRWVSTSRRRRPLQEFLEKTPTAKLTHCKRCGPRVCEFVARLFPFASDFRADDRATDATWLWHVFYNGRAWEPAVMETREGQGATGLAQSSRTHEPPVAWHPVLFKCLLAMCANQVAYLRESSCRCVSRRSTRRSY